MKYILLGNLIECVSETKLFKVSGDRDYWMYQKGPYNSIGVPVCCDTFAEAFEQSKVELQRRVTKALLDKDELVARATQAVYDRQAELYEFLGKAFPDQKVLDAQIQSV